MDENLSDIVSAFSRDAHAAAAARGLPGLRLIRVDPPECLLSFIFSPQNRIPNIARIFNNVCRIYGRRVMTPWGAFYGVPDFTRLARTRPHRLAACGLRYGEPQAKNLIRTVKNIAAVPDFFEKCAAPNASYKSAHCRLVDTCFGAGHKVADCVCLMALGHLDAVPVDVHVFNATLRLYRRYLPGLRAVSADHLTAKEYNRIGNFYRARFGRMAGYAQQYLFTAERARRQKTPRLVPG